MIASVRGTDGACIGIEIRVCAERRAGEMLAQTEKAAGARGNPNGRGAPVVRSDDATAQAPTLAQMGITKDQSSRWQQLAAMTEDHFKVRSRWSNATTAGKLGRA